MKLSFIKKRYLSIVLILTILPLVRDIGFNLILNHELNITDFHYILHSGGEMLLMFIFGIGFCIFDSRINNEKKQKQYLNSLAKERTKEIRLNQQISVETFALLAEYRDQDTGDHLKRVQNYVKVLTIKLMEDSPYKSYLLKGENYLEDLMMASVLHDIGKIAIPNEILLKPGKLTDEEFDTMKTHSVFGGEILGKANQSYFVKTGTDSYLALARDIAMYHHEKWNGTGYPKGLKQNEIPLSARIVALCDVYDAVTFDRVYKKAWTHEKAKNMILDSRASHFDPVITDAFDSLSETFDQIRIKYSD